MQAANIALVSTASADRSPWLRAFIRLRALPSGVLGPVDRSHGLTRAVGRSSGRGRQPRGVGGIDMPAGVWWGVTR